MVPTSAIGRRHLRDDEVVRIGRAKADELARHYLRPGDILFARRGAQATGLSAIVETRHAGWLCGTGAIRLRVPPGHVRPDYLSFALSSDETLQWLRHNAIGATMPNLNEGVIRRIPVSLPPLHEQRAIASILGALDDKMELNRRMNETLEALARTIFKSWFVDFDPVRAKVQGRAPTAMDAETAALFPNRFVESELGEIPEGWRATALGERTTALSGGTPAKSDPSFWGGDLPWISPKVMTEIHADEADAFVTRPAVGNGTRLAPSGSTLVMVRGMGLHKQVRVSQARREVTFNQDVKALVPTGIEPTLLLLALLDAQPTLLGRVQSAGHGTGVLPTDILLAHRLCLPSPGVQRVLVAPLDAMNDRIAAGRSETRTLAELRDLLLPKLISGELRIPDAEKLVEDVA